MKSVKIHSILCRLIEEKEPIKSASTLLFNFMKYGVIQILNLPAHKLISWILVFQKAGIFLESITKRKKAIPSMFSVLALSTVAAPLGAFVLLSLL